MGLPPLGKTTVVTSPEQIKSIHESVKKGKRLDTSKFDYTTKKSVKEILNGK